MLSIMKIYNINIIYTVCFVPHGNDDSWFNALCNYKVKETQP